MKKMQARTILLMASVLLLAFSTAAVQYRPLAQIPVPMVITYPLDGSTIATTQPTVTGTYAPSGSVYVYYWHNEAWSGPICPGLIANGSGAWSCSLGANGVTLPLGDNAIMASYIPVECMNFSYVCFNKNFSIGAISPMDLVEFTVTDATPIWYIPGGIPNGVATRMLPLESMTQFVYNGITYNPPETWQLFAGQGLKVKIKNWITPSVQVCFAYPKALTGWHGQIYFLQGGKWVGQATNQITISGYGTLPFLCTMATKTGVYIVID